MAAGNKPSFMVSRSRVTLSASGSLVIQGGWAISHIFAEETAGHAVNGGLKFGTSSEASDIVAALAVSSNQLTFVSDAALLKRLFSMTAPQTVFIDAVSDWNGAHVDIQVMLLRVKAYFL